ncbi:MAG: CoA transferase [Sphingomonadaceae bacterium]|nr:CoA transferase [Sphingomonadaceae bacterium]
MDGWLAVNLPRADDLDLVPAWLGHAVRGDLWRGVVAEVASRPAMELVDQARLLGLPVARVGEVAPGGPAVAARPLGVPRLRDGVPRVVDLSAMWAGPLCGAVLADMGADVTRYEDSRRPDPTRTATPNLYRRLNRRKRHATIDLGSRSGLAAMAGILAEAHIVITSARSRAFAAWGLNPEVVAGGNPGLTWVAISGHGWEGDGADRVAFGDDAAAAGGLLRWTRAGAPRFAGDALADPLTGLAAAAAAMRAWSAGGGVLVDAALARVAADAVRR